jgi:5-methyltetrahydrofolate corrinoid/iron sulfur protein methyltransferase
MEWLWKKEGKEPDLILVADNLRITNPSIQGALESLDPKPIREMVRQCVAAGADAIDINSGPLSRDPEEKMGFLVKTVQGETDLPVLLDTANPRAIKGGLQENRKKAVISGFSLEPNKLKEVLPLARDFDVEIIGYLLQQNSQVPADIQDRLSIAVELYMACREAGIPENRLIIDPVVAPITWTDGPARNQELLSILRDLPEVLGFPVRTIAGLSNLTAGARDREKRQALEMAYLPMMAASGLTMVLLDIFNRPIVRAAKACRMLTGRKPFAWGDMDV